MTDSSSRTFTFKVKVGQSMPERTVKAPSDQEGYENINKLLATEPSGTTFVPNSLILHEQTTKTMPDLSLEG